MPIHSAGILLYKLNNDVLEVFLAHPGGPYFVHKDEGVWSIPKGMNESGEAMLETAQREFKEETGFSIAGDFVELGVVRLRSGKMVHAWALEGDVNADDAVSNTFEMEWPRHSGKVHEYPEMDCAAWYRLPQARLKIMPGQLALLDRLVEYLTDAGRIAG